MDFSYLTVLPRGRQIWDFVVFPPEEFDDHREKLIAILDELKVDGLMVYSDGSSRRYVSYVTNYCNSVSWSVSFCLITRDRDPIIISSMAPRDINYNLRFLAPKLELSAAGLSLLCNDHVGGKTVAYMKEHDLMGKKWAGVNLQSLSKIGAAPINEAFGSMFDATPHFDKVIARKTEREIFAVTQAASMAKKTALDYLRMAVPGTTEREIAARVDRALRVYGVDNVALLVSAGKGPVALRQPSGYVIEDGDTVAVHISVLYLHYNGMFAATLYHGQKDAPRARFYDSVKERFDSAVAKIEKQKSLAGMYEFSESGYMIAQGIGSDVAEAPFAEGENHQLEDGSVFTLTLCADNGALGGVMLSDTFANRGGRVYSVGGEGVCSVHTHEKRS